ncbi:DUF2784 domain-containing protein [Nocardioides sp.]|uniref:DUF2784 domain-containing protein n=1 Tax=Nocardioides sp. TaxID=35761 RepID=UPI0027345646|nr:DUF2784 domain-containing protein [Nocardioides sp.]MDP3891006.1 DUF2784 domain-containing protein [Nocardioides sp.]
MWALLAEGMVVFHLAYLLYLSFGGLLALRSTRWLVPHVAVVVWAIVVVVMQWRCPLTSLEKDWWARAGETPYAGSFLDHYIFGTYLPDGSQALVYALQLTLIAGLYVVVARRLRHPARADSTSVVVPGTPEGGAGT